MRAVNIKKNQMSMNKRINIPIDLSDRQPCWYAQIELKNGKEKANWVVGLKRPREEKDEYSFKISKAGDVNDETFWTYASSTDFAIKLIEVFKINGKSEVDKWIKEGCKR